ncbi:hypothetical protein MTO96_043699, partial [Rhipicephalus appendiculatus]
SGTEDEYEEQDQLLQELLDLAKEYNYKYRRIRKISDKHCSDRGAARLTKSAAGHSRDDAAAAYAATVNNNGTDTATPSLPIRPYGYRKQRHRNCSGREATAGPHVHPRCQYGVVRHSSESIPVVTNRHYRARSMVYRGQETRAAPRVGKLHETGLCGLTVNKQFVMDHLL